MRLILALAGAFLLSACGMQQNCDAVKLTEASVEQIRAIAEVCGKAPDAIAQQQPATLAERMAAEAQRMGMTPQAYAQTDAGRLMIYREYWKEFGSVIVGVLMIAMMWLTVLRILWWFSRSPNRIERKPFLWGLWHRVVVTEWEGVNVEASLIGWMMAAGIAYTVAIYFGVIGW